MDAGAGGPSRRRFVDWLVGTTLGGPPPRPLPKYDVRLTGSGIHVSKGA